MTHTLLPVLIMMLIAVVVGVVMLALAWFVGGHARTASKQEPYESGVPSLDENRKRVNGRFYQIAMLFILFDIEAAFLYPWTVIYRRPFTGAPRRLPSRESVSATLTLALRYLITRTS